MHVWFSPADTYIILYCNALGKFNCPSLFSPKHLINLSELNVQVWFLPRDNWFTSIFLFILDKEGNVGDWTIFCTYDLAYISDKGIVINLASDYEILLKLFS